MGRREAGSGQGSPAELLAPRSGAGLAVSGWPRCPAGAHRAALAAAGRGRGGPAAVCAGSRLCSRDVPPGAGGAGR